MDVSLRLYNDVVQIPTSYAIRAGFYFAHMPLEMVPVEQTEKLRQAILAAIERGNPPISGGEARALSDSKENPLLRAAGVPSWNALDRQTKGLWSIIEKNDLYQIRVDQPMQPRGWHEDKTKRMEFPPGTPVDNVITRLIVMIQERAKQ